jgi:autotransporter-associated beta strand protein
VKALASKLTLAVIVLFPLLTTGQTLTLTNGTTTYVALTNTTVTMTGRTELKITAASNPIPGCLIHLNSSTAWFFLPNIRPSTVISTYLGQLRVNGANAIADSNVRVVPYAMGTVVIPHAPSFLPLQVFSGQNFLGASANFGIYTYYNTSAALGAMNRNISSFKLKRGYSATFAQNADGTGASKVYIAQDADLEVGVMATNLERQCSFVRVFPWRWTGKKGWDDVAGENSLIKPLWFYDWGSGSTSSADAEYAPMQWGGGYSSGINSKQKSTHVLGFNEPDDSKQANMTVAQAVANWPSMVQSGLRLGAPAVSDAFGTGVGLDWLYSFMSQIDALGYRVDYVPVHWYKCDQTAAQLYSYLLGVYQTTGRPIWLTEFNDGANWCVSAPPTYAQHATATQEMLDVLESAPFVERYAIYNWVGDTRAMITNNALTPAGIIYRDRQSALGHVQALPPGGSRSIAQFQFDTDTLDSSGYGNNGFASGIPNYPSGHTGQALALDGTNFIQLPPNIANSASFTFAAWVNWNGGGNWQRIFDFGDDTSHYLFLSPSSGSGTLRFAIKNGGGEQMIETTGLPVGQWRHVAITLSGSNARLYTNGVLAASSSGFTIVPSNFNPNLNYLGKSQFNADPLFRGNLDEVQIADFAMTPEQIAALQTNSPPQFPTNLLARMAGTQGVAYNDDIMGTATDPDPDDALTYSKAGGPAWLNISANGTLTGTPGAGVGGTNNFTVRVTDAAGASAFALLTIYIVPVTVSGSWSADASGNWSDTTKWSSGFVANAASYTADFSAINIAADRTVTLDSSRSIGALKFGDAVGAQNWILNSSGGSILTLDLGNSGPPAIAVTNTATVSVPLAGTNGFIKTGPGALVLSGTNTVGGNTRITEGTVRLANSNALQNATVNLDSSDAGTLTFSGITVANVGGLRGSRNLALANLSAAGVILNVDSSGADSFAGILSGVGSLVKSGSGVLTLTSSNTYTGVGGTVVSGGTLKLARDPVAKFTFDSVGGTGVGSVVTNGGSGGSAMNAVVTSSSVSYSAGKFGNALSLTASGAYLKVPHKIVATDASGSWTVGFWVKTATAGAMILYQGDGGWSSSGQTTYLLNANSGSTPGTRAGAVRWAGGFLTGTAVLNDNNWHFVTLVDNAGTQSIYVDGNVDAVTSTMGLALASSANQTWIGNAPDSDAGAIKMTGQIDDVYLFNRALSLAEVRSLTNTVPGLIAGNFGGQLPSSTSLTVAAGAAFDLGGNSQTVASLADSSGGGGIITNSGAAPVILTLGGTSGPKTFSGVIADRSLTNSISLVKNGAATAILAGANSFRGPTIVNAGTLLVNGGLGSSAVTANAGTLGGNGWIGGPVVVQPAATLSPGTSMGVLTFSNNLTLAGTTFIEIDKSLSTNDLVQVSGTLNYGGTLTIVNLAGSLAAGDAFKVFDAAASNGSFGATNWPALDPGLGWNFDAANGTLSIVQTVALDPTDLATSFVNDTLTLSWPSDHLGWRLETNSVNISDTNFWFTLPGSDLTNQVSLTIDPASSNVFFRLTFP